MPLSMMSRGDWVTNTTAPFRLRIVRSCCSMMPRRSGRSAPASPRRTGSKRRAVEQQRDPVIEIGQRRAAGARVLEEGRRVEPVQIAEPDGVDRRVDDPAELAAPAPLVERAPAPSGSSSKNARSSPSPRSSGGSSMTVARPRARRLPLPRSSDLPPMQPRIRSVRNSMLRGAASSAFNGAKCGSPAPSTA